MDDFLIFSNDEKFHIEHLNTVSSLLNDQKLYVSPKKCEFMKSKILFLGMIVGNDGIQVDPKKFEFLQNSSKPTTLTDLRSFMGVLQNFRRFIKDFSKIATPLTDLTRKGVGIQKWDIERDNASESLKNSITTAPIPVAPDGQNRFEVILMHLVQLLVEP